MRRAHTVEQVREAERALMARLPEGTLMQRAAAGLATAVVDLLGSAYGRRVLLLVGSGDNGGDALHAGAMLARRGVAVEALLLAADRTHAGGLAALRRAGGRVVDAVPVTSPDLVVDGIVGIGGSGPLRPEAAEVVGRLADVPFVAVDTPSGVGVDDATVRGPHVEATLTVTFGTHKVAHLVDPAARACGIVHLVDIGLDLPEAPVEALQAADVAALLPVPAPDAHKYTRGVVGLRTGSATYRGAAVLSTAGASCGLAGMVRYVGGAADLVQAAHPEVVLGAGRVQAWVVGSGGGEAAVDEVAAAVADRVPVVLDADALAAVRGPLPVPAVLTPHAGELARMLGVGRDEVEAEQLRYAGEAADAYQAVVLLKGRHTLAARPGGRVGVATVGPPWLATAGAGDVLAGLVGALLAAGLTPYDAAAAGSWLHGAAGALASRGGPLTAPAVAAALPETVRVLHRAGGETLPSG
jgi:ADP-dependent NAD(P)H-hydrate dehydratase / NAD(P)H-hydrate epimerase